MNLSIAPLLKEDLDSAYDLINFYADQGIVLPRSKKNILKEIENFLVARINNQFVGIISFYDYGPNLKEIRSLVVKKNFSNQNIGSSLLINLVNKIIKKNLEQIPKIFVLTFSPKFFEKNGFCKVEKSYFPEKIWKDCQKCKNKDDCGETALIYKN